MLNGTVDDQSMSVVNTPSSMNKSMFYYLQSCGCFSCNEKYFTDRRDYDSLLLIYTTGGRGYLEYKGRSFSTGVGQVFIIDCMEHQYYATDRNTGFWEFKFIHFNGSESRKYLKRISENDDYVLNTAPLSCIPRNMDKILDMAAHNDTRLDIITSCLIVEILTELLLASCNYNAKKSFIPPYIEKAIALVEDMYTSEIGIDDIAKALSTDKFYLTKQFKKYLGQSLYEYITNFRLNKSKHLLRTTPLTVGEISEKVGFESASHFIKMFKRDEGITPLKYRNYWR